MMISTAMARPADFSKIARKGRVNICDSAIMAALNIDNLR